VRDLGAGRGGDGALQEGQQDAGRGVPGVLSGARPGGGRAGGPAGRIVQLPHGGHKTGNVVGVDEPTGVPGGLYDNALAVAGPVRETYLVGPRDIPVPAS